MTRKDKPAKPAAPPPRTLRSLIGLAGARWCAQRVLARRAGVLAQKNGTAKQKFQKWYAEDEFRALLRPYFRDVRRASLDVRDSALVMVCRRPVVMRKAQLAAALRFEFELKIDGKPLGRSDRAMAAFGHYLDRNHRAV